MRNYLIQIQEWAARQIKHGVVEVYEISNSGAMRVRRPRVRAQLLFAWYDMWVGVFIDTKKAALYLFPIPMLGIKVFIG